MNHQINNQLLLQNKDTILSVAGTLEVENFRKNKKGNRMVAFLTNYPNFLIIPGWL
jgi:hypothetical protein